MSNNDKSGTGAAFLSVGIGAGLALGAALGLALDNLALGMGAGLAVGSGLGVALMSAAMAKAKKDQNGQGQAGGADDPGDGGGD